MVRRQDNGSRAVNGVDARSEHTNLFVTVLNLKIDKRAFTAADPIALPLQNLFRPTRFDLFNIGDELFRVVCDPQEPLLQIALLDRRSATPTDSAGRLLV